MKQPIFTKHTIGVLALMLLSLVYKQYSKIKYSNCKISQFEFIDIDSNKILVSAKLPKFRNIKGVHFTVNDVSFPNKGSSNICERKMYDKVYKMLYGIAKQKDSILFLENCLDDHQETSGYIISSNKNIFIDMKERKMLLKRNKLGFFKRLFSKKEQSQWCDLL